MKTKKAVFLGVAILMMVSLMLPLGCTTDTDTETTTEFKTYSGFGFSFDYPRGYSITEMGLLESEATDSSGSISAAKGDNRLYQVAWMSMIENVWEIGGGLQFQIDNFFFGMEMTGEVRVDKGELVESVKAGHEMVYQFYSMTYNEIDKAYGIIGVFYCDRSEKCFILVTGHTDISAKQDVLEDYQRFLDSFVCH